MCDGLETRKEWIIEQNIKESKEYKIKYMGIKIYKKIKNITYISK